MNAERYANTMSVHVMWLAFSIDLHLLTSTFQLFDNYQCICNQVLN
jgi:hypothetical protein